MIPVSPVGDQLGGNGNGDLRRSFRLNGDADGGGNLIQRLIRKAVFLFQRLTDCGGLAAARAMCFSTIFPPESRKFSRWQSLPLLPTSIRAPAPRGVAPEEAMTVTITRFSPGFSVLSAFVS